MIKWQKVLFSDFLTERKNRFKPKDVNALGLKRVDKINFSAEIFISDKPTNTDMILVKKGDLLISGINAEKGAIAVYEGDDDVLASIHYSSYQFDKKKINIDYLKWFLISDAFRKHLKEQSGGGIKTELKAKHILPLQIDLPDLETQKEIVKKISLRDKNYSELFSELTTQQTLITQLRQSILREAVQGKLLRPLSEPQIKNDKIDFADKKQPRLNQRNHLIRSISGSDSGEELLKQIKAEKEKLIKAGKLKKEKPLPPISESEIPYQLPEGWVWCRLKEVCLLITDGKHGDSQNEPNSGYYFLSAKDIQKGIFLYDYARQITFKDFEEVHRRTNLEAGDICIVNTGGTVGKMAIAPDSPLTSKTTFQKSVAVIKVMKKLIENRYIEIILRGCTNKLIKVSGGSAINNLLIGDLNNLLIPLPPLPEQKRIVEKVNQLMQHCNELEQQVQQSTKHAQQLMQAVLREVFEKSSELRMDPDEISGQVMIK